MNKDKALLERQDLWPAQLDYQAACSASRAHDLLTKACLRRHGDHGTPISGVVRDHFPDGSKRCLRILARMVTSYCDAAEQKRPKGVRAETMRALAKAVARRDGSGFYGPRG